MHKKFDSGSDLSFRYTDDIARFNFIEEIYPISNLLIKSISKIPWKKYVFEDETQFSIINDDTEEEEIFNLNVVSRLSSFPYYILGGASCELYGKKYRNVVKIHDIVDPSADIDIRIQFPCLFEKDNLDLNSELKYKEYDMLISYKNKVSNLTEHYTHWLFDEVVKMIEKNVSYFDEYVCSLPDLKDEHETAQANLAEAVGPILITRSYLFNDNAIKIQVSTKVNNESQHFIEFILVLNSQDVNSIINRDYDIKQNEKKYQKIDNVYVQHLDYLLDAQYDAFINRFREQTGQFLYKIYNHCARILFLLRIYKHLKEKNELTANQKFFITSSQINKKLEKFYRLLETSDVRNSYCSKFTEEIKELLEFIFPNSIDALKNKILNENKKKHITRSASIFQTIRSRRKKSSSSKKKKNLTQNEI
jgi:hypothetical protein